MSRPERTNEENKTIEAFLKKLETQGVDYAIDESITDKPDLVLIIDGKRIGYELTTVTLQQYEKWSRSKRKNATLKKIDEHRIPNKPDEWVANSITDKTEKISSYKLEHDLDIVNLIVHIGFLPAFGNDEETLNRLMWSCQETENEFDEIWFVGEKQKVTKLWHQGKEKIKKPPPPQHNQIVHKQISVDLTGGGVTLIDFGDKEPEKSNSPKSQFFRAAFFNDLKQIKIFTRFGMKVNMTDKLGFTALRYAAGRGNIEIVKFLLSKGADPTIMETNQQSSLIEICERRGLNEIVELLK
ncbi:ankyrin repeat domain-containing protein [Seonamhaeicola maritimus]|uniref:Ankyrin repeat domain-containing protein n=1 Tax=Seonamhaeicola maritimus TaxID=2591822 RepID=A0A5C7GHH5_9FLAO|nr:ankyrin repeat domain-containing protein [Seonamhaeicola maritimus]TXG36982.1 ankyrin repeat domain-containing protein [Seonamhaeicola maritimus]